MNRLAAVLGIRSLPVRSSFGDWYDAWYEKTRQNLIRYFESLADKVDTDTLTFREGFSLFALGGLITQIFLWISSLLS